ncbi:MAG: Holliday junction resolvase RuvX [Coriobacteriia bacterium]|nr:Holliday junction resolvase RuvX [Coriobacteriia bacterium]
MKVLALDIGEKRIGIACGDTDTRVAVPLTTLQASEVLSNSAAFREIIEERQPGLLVIGLPISLDGTEQQQAKRVRKIAEKITKMLDLPLVFQDERLSSSEARRLLRESGCTEREMRGKIDMLAATYFLQAYFDLLGL